MKYLDYIQISISVRGPRTFTFRTRYHVAKCRRELVGAPHLIRIPIEQYTTSCKQQNVVLSPSNCTINVEKEYGYASKTWQYFCCYSRISLTFVVIFLTKMDRILRFEIAIWRITFCKNYCKCSCSALYGPQGGKIVLLCTSLTLNEAISYFEGHVFLSKTPLILYT